MKKLALFFIVLASIVVFFTCNVALAQTVISCGTPEEVTLYADQTIDVGTITAYNDSDNLYVKYTTTGGWVLDETHLAVATSLDDIPQKKGNPVVGNFPYKLVHLSVTEYVYVINLEEAGYTVDTELYIAAHADVSLIDDYGNIVQEEGAWGSGNNFPGKNWATFFTYSVQLGNQALLGGGLSKAEVRAYRLSDLKNPIEGPVVTSESSIDISGAGLFSLQISGLPEDEYILLAVSNGKDTDADGDGLIDIESTTNNGSICALLTVKDINQGKFNISMLSDISWRFAKNLIGLVDQGELLIRLNDLSKAFIQEDINDDGIVNYNDILSFSSLKIDDINKLNFDYNILFTNDDTNNTVVKCYHNNDIEALLVLLEKLFGNSLSLHSIPDNRYNKVKIEVAVFGNGSFVSDKGGIDYSSNRSSNNNTTAFLYRSLNEKITITATPEAGSKILSWEGCDETSSDMTECLCSLKTDRLISVNFGYEETILKDDVSLIDLSETLTTINDDQTIVNVEVSHGDTGMVEILANADIGDIIVGSAGGGFLLRVVSIEKESDYKYTFHTEDASLEEVIAQGSGILKKQLTHEDLEGIVQTNISNIQTFGLRSLSTSTIQTPATPAYTSDEPIGFDAIEGIKLLAPDKPNDTQFNIKIGNDLNPNALLMLASSLESELEGEVEWKTNDGTTVKAKGEVTLSIDFETGVSYGLFSGLEYFKFIPKVTAEENVEVTYGGEIKTKEDFPKKWIATLHFAPISFMIGPVPVWVKPEVPIYIGANGKVSAELTTGITLKQTFKAGIVYNKNVGINPIMNFNHSFDWDKPNAEVSAEVKGYIQPQVTMKVYSAMGPAIPINGYLKLKGEVDATKLFVDGCTEGITLSFFAGIEAKLKWDFGEAGKLGKWIGVDASKVEFKIFEGEKLLKVWNAGGICGDTPPFLKLDGLDIAQSIMKGTQGIEKFDYIITNSGTSELEWEIEFLDDEVTTISQLSGKLREGESNTITVSVDTDKLDVGIYQNVIKFINKYDPGLVSSIPTGSTSRSIIIDVTPLPLAAPEMTAEMDIDLDGEIIPTVVNLSWIYPNSQTFGYVDGYMIFQTTTPNVDDSWIIIRDVTSPNIYQHRVTNLYSNTTYYFRIIAYGSGVRTTEEAMEQYQISIKTPEIDPAGDCRCHFSGALMNDHFITGWTSEVYVEDNYSEYVGAGSYSLNSSAFPKATSTTFDGIAIDAGTKVTIYSQPNYQGSILYEKIGPAIINNAIWKNYSQVQSVMYDWKEPLQSTYPQSVREWSSTNMHNWPSGSMKIECGYSK